MRILITGTSGPLSIGFQTISKDQNLNSGCEFLFNSRKQFNLLDINQTQECINYHKPDIVINLAASSGGIDLNGIDSSILFESNLLLGLNLSLVCARSKIHKLINISSISAYPKNFDLPHKEENLFLGPPHDSDFLYATSKRLFAPISQSMNKFNSSNQIVVFVNGIGGRGLRFDGPNTVMLAGIIKRFFQAKSKKESLFEVFGNPNNLRQYTNGRELAQAILWVATNMDGFKILNVGTSESMTIMNIALKVAEFLDIDTELVKSSHDSKIDSEKHQCFDNSKFIDLSGFRFSSINQTIFESVEWYTKIVKS